MSVVPGSIETDSQPPTALPLGHFTVGFGFLLAAAFVSVADAAGVVPGMGQAGQRHLLLAGWVCLTIMGAMTQFVPVWAGVELYSRRLGVAQLWLTAAGVTGLATALLVSLPWLFLPAGALLVSGVWTFVYNLGQTVRQVDSLDVTVQHFAVALLWFAVLAPLGLLLAAGLSGSSLGVPVARGQLLGAHVTLAVFGAILTTVVGALYQLGTMFTQTSLQSLDLRLQRFERIVYHPGVALLAGGRLVGDAAVATVGGCLVASGLFAVSVVLARRLLTTSVDWTPMLSRYAVLTGALAGWSVFAFVAWLGQPLARSTLLGAPGTAPLLLVGVIGFAVLGTLYHVVPFIVWVDCYSDRLGLEAVPMIDDLYDDRLAAADFWLFTTGLVVLLVTGLTGLAWGRTAGSLCLAAGAVVFVANLLAVLRDHGPESLPAVVFGTPWRSQ